MLLDELVCRLDAVMYLMIFLTNRLVVKHLSTQYESRTQVLRLKENNNTFNCKPEIEI